MALQLIGKDVPLVVKEKLKKSELTTAQNKGVSMITWMDKKPMSYIYIFHTDTMITVSKTGRDPYKPRSIQEYSLFMGRVDLKVKNLLIVRRTNWYIKLLKRVLNTLVHDVFGLYREHKIVNKIFHLAFRL
jgi:hypothetical protein